MATEQKRRLPLLRNAERLKFFTDAVVAIAMTLLILPLIESVSDAADARLTTVQFLVDHRVQLVSFALSFVLIASFWTGHERLYSQVRSWYGPLMLLNFGWMFTIVFLPVATAIVGSFVADNALVALYIGTLLATNLFMAAMNVVILRTPELWAEGAQPGYDGLSVSLGLSLLFAVALVVGLLLPEGKFLSLFLLFLNGPVQHAIQRTLERRAPGRGPSEPIA